MIGEVPGRVSSVSFSFQSPFDDSLQKRAVHLGMPFLSTFQSYQGEKFGCRSGRDDVFTRQGVKHSEGLCRASVHNSCWVVEGLR